MAGKLHSLGWLSAALVAALLLAALTPVCAMAECRDTGPACGSDFRPACGGCPSPVVMKHASDEGVTTAPVTLEPPVALAPTPVAETPLLVCPTCFTPETTASPPPLDPLGVRLTL